MGKLQKPEVCEQTLRHSKFLQPLPQQTHQHFEVQQLWQIRRLLSVQRAPKHQLYVLNGCPTVAAVQLLRQAPTKMKEVYLSLRLLGNCLEEFHLLVVSLRA
ncbi:hypothetical protein SRHO_G00028020 [Serrasalmus rhombeus]